MLPNCSTWNNCGTGRPGNGFAWHGGYCSTPRNCSTWNNCDKYHACLPQLQMISEKCDSISHLPERERAYAVAMIRNRSVPADIVLPHIVYSDLPRAIEWLTRVFGFVEHFHYGDPISGAQLHLGNAWIMASATRESLQSPAELGAGTQCLTIFLEEVEAHFARAKSAGATIVEEPHETVYGEFQYAAIDLEGHRWLFSRHARDLSPDAWGATIVNPL